MGSSRRRCVNHTALTNSHHARMRLRLTRSRQTLRCYIVTSERPGCPGFPARGVYRHEVVPVEHQTWRAAGAVCARRPVRAFVWSFPRHRRADLARRSDLRRRKPTLISTGSILAADTASQIRPAAVSIQSRFGPAAGRCPARSAPLSLWRTRCWLRRPRCCCCQQAVELLAPRHRCGVRSSELRSASPFSLAHPRSPDIDCLMSPRGTATTCVAGPARNESKSVRHVDGKRFLPNSSITPENSAALFRIMTMPFPVKGTLLLSSSASLLLGLGGPAPGADAAPAGNGTTTLPTSWSRRQSGAAAANSKRHGRGRGCQRRAARHRQPRRRTPQRSRAACRQKATNFDQARSNIYTTVGTTSDTISHDTIQDLPQGTNQSVEQVLLQAPGVSQDSAASGSAACPQRSRQPPVPDQRGVAA